MNRTMKSALALLSCAGIFSISMMVYAESEKPADHGQSTHGSAAAAPAEHAEHAAPSNKVSPTLALKRLKDGNLRYTTNHVEHPHQSAERRAELANTQKPYAIILGCADSRTSPEVLFDQGLGDIFVVRQAGNVVDDHSIGSIEYAAEHLNSGLIVVLGHERCGAVKAARETIAANTHAPGHIDSLIESIRPAVEATSGKDAEETCRANVLNVVNALRTSKPILNHLVEKGELKIVGAYYDLDTGTVTFLDEPKQVASGE